MCSWLQLIEIWWEAHLVLRVYAGNRLCFERCMTVLVTSAWAHLVSNTAGQVIQLSVKDGA